MAIGSNGQLISIWRRGKEIYLDAVGGAEELLSCGKNPVIANGSKGTYATWTDLSGVQLLALGAKDPVSLDASGRYVQLLAFPGGFVLASWQSEGQLIVEAMPWLGAVKRLVSDSPHHRQPKGEECHYFVTIARRTPVKSRETRGSTARP